MIINGNRNYELTRSKNLQEPVDIWTDICELTPVDDECQDKGSTDPFGSFCFLVMCIGRYDSDHFVQGLTVSSPRIPG